MDFQETKKHTDQLLTDFAERNTMNEGILQQWLMEWKDPPVESWIKKTMSPTPHNYVAGAIRLMMTTRPQFNVPMDESDKANQEASELIEQAAQALWLGSGKALRHPPEYDAVASAILFAEVCGSLTQTSELVQFAQTSQNQGAIARMEALAARTPYLFHIYDPSTCYPDADTFGLRGMLRRTELTTAELLDAWGAKADAQISSTRQKRTKWWVRDWYDWENRTVWLENKSEPLYHDAHGLPFLPVVSQITEGVSFLGKPEQQRMPLLYSVFKSGLWERESLMLTVIYSLIFAIGSHPLLKRKAQMPGSPLIINRTIPGGVVDVATDEDIGALMEKVVDPSQWSGLETAARLIEDSTMPKQAMGGPPKTAMPFSAISLLAQAGRLPLTGPKELGGDALAELVTSALMWARADAIQYGSGPLKLYNPAAGRAFDFDPGKLPERITLTCTLETDLPQDRLSMIGAADAMVKGGHASRRYVREHVLNIRQSKAMEEEIYHERRNELDIQARLAAKAEELKAKYGPQAQMPGGRQPAGSQVPPQAAAPGQPLTEPVEPMAAGEAGMEGESMGAEMMPGAEGALPPGAGA
jgi:hypothetical protein